VHFAVSVSSADVLPSSRVDQVVDLVSIKARLDRWRRPLLTDATVLGSFLVAIADNGLSAMTDGFLFRCRSLGLPLCGCQRVWVLAGLYRVLSRNMANRTSRRRRASAIRGLVVTLALTDLASVVGPGDRITQCCEGRQEQRAFELRISTSRWMFAADGSAGASRHGREASVCRQMSRGGERSARDIDQESRRGPDAAHTPAVVNETNNRPAHQEDYLCPGVKDEPGLV